MPKSLQIPYYPKPAPLDAEDLPRYIDEELHRIREALIAQPVATAVKESGAFSVTTAVVWEQVFFGVDPDWDVPGGGWDPITAKWTNPQQGLYQFNLQLEVDPFGTGNKNYYARVSVVVDDGTTTARHEAVDGGADDVPLGVTAAGLIPLNQGDIVWAEMTIVHDQFTGDADYNIAMQILNVST